MTVDLLTRLKQRYHVVRFGGRHGQLVAQSGIDRESGRGLVGILHVSVCIVAANMAREITDTLQEDDRLPGEKAGERVCYREWREYEEAVGCDPLQHVDLLMLISAAKLELIFAAHPAQRCGVIEDVFVRVARASDRISYCRITIHLDERRSSGDLETRRVLESKA